MNLGSSSFVDVRRTLGFDGAVTVMKKRRREKTGVASKLNGTRSGLMLSH